MKNHYIALLNAAGSPVVSLPSPLKVSYSISVDGVVSGLRDLRLHLGVELASLDDEVAHLVLIEIQSRHKPRSSSPFIAFFLAPAAPDRNAGLIDFVPRLPRRATRRRSLARGAAHPSS